MAGKKYELHLFETECPVCGNVFYPSPVHAYKDRRSPYKKVCSWKCVRTSERLKNQNAKRKKRGHDYGESI